jgi:hypothetical protein
LIHLLQTKAMKFTPLILLSVLFAPLSCGSGAASNPPLPTKLTEEFKSYWFDGTAEVTSYHLTQARYGELRSGEAVFIFVTEPFSKSKQVKKDHTTSDDPDRVDVLKLNATRKFNTGLYPYSLMSSVFQPLDGSSSHAIKSTTSVQEWCGHTYLETNRHKKEIHVSGKSYFESDGDIEFNIPLTWLEDELWGLMRLNPKDLPVGDFSLVPGGMYLRMAHKEIQSYSAHGHLSEEAGQFIYTIEIPEFDKVLKIWCSNSFPYTIDRWEDTYVSGWGESAKRLTTTATLNKRIKTDYWTKNTNADSTMRAVLGLD